MVGSGSTLLTALAHGRASSCRSGIWARKDAKVLGWSAPGHQAKVPNCAPRWRRRDSRRFIGWNLHPESCRGWPRVAEGDGRAVPGAWSWPGLAEGDVISPSPPASRRRLIGGACFARNASGWHVAPTPAGKQEVEAALWQRQRFFHRRGVAQSISIGAGPARGGGGLIDERVTLTPVVGGDQRRASAGEPRRRRSLPFRRTGVGLQDLAVAAASSRFAVAGRAWRRSVRL